MEQPPLAKPSVTVADVARAAGVSKATAARVLGGYGIVSDAVREKVLAVAKALDYRPNELARSMTTGRSGAIGVVVGDIENPFFSAAVRGISDVGARRRLHRDPGQFRRGHRGREGRHPHADRQAGRRADRHAVTVPRDRPSAGCPALRPAAGPARPRHPGARRRHGHGRRPRGGRGGDPPADRAWPPPPRLCHRLRHAGAHLSRPRPTSTPPRSGSVSKAFSAPAARPRIPSPAVRLGAIGREATRELAMDLLRSPEPPTAILASDSVIALEIFKVARELGFRDPRRPVADHLPRCRLDQRHQPAGHRDRPAGASARHGGGRAAGVAAERL